MISSHASRKRLPLGLRVHVGAVLIEQLSRAPWQEGGEGLSSAGSRTARRVVLVASPAAARTPTTYVFSAANNTDLPPVTDNPRRAAPYHRSRVRTMFLAVCLHSSDRFCVLFDL